MSEPDRRIYLVPDPKRGKRKGMLPGGGVAPRGDLLSARNAAAPEQTPPSPAAHLAPQPAPPDTPTANPDLSSPPVADASNPETPAEQPSQDASPGPGGGLKNALKSGGKKGAKGIFSSSKKWKWIAGGGGILAGIGTLVGIFFWLLLFKNVHFQHLYMDYRLAKFNYSLNQRLGEALKESQKGGVAEAKGTAETPTATNAEDAPPDVQLADANAAELDKIRAGGTDAVANEATDISLYSQSTADVGGVTAAEFGYDYNIKDPTTTDTPTAEAATEAEVAGNDSATLDKIPKDIKDQAEEAAKLQDEQGLSAADAAKAAAEKSGLSAGEVLHGVNGILTVVTFYCIFRQIYVDLKDSTTKLLMGGAARVADTTAKTADCQKQGNCSLTVIGATANRFDSNKESATQSCGYARATGAGSGNCKEIDPAYIINSGVNILGLSPDQAAAAKALDNFLDPGKSSVLGFISRACPVLLDPRFQVAQLVVTITALIFAGPAGAAGEAVAQGIFAALGTAGGKALLVQAVMQHNGGLFKKIGPILFGNLMDMGAKSIGAGVSQHSGGQPLTATQAQAFNTVLRQQEIATENRKGFFYKYFSPENNHSVTVQVAMQMPSSPGALSARISSLFAALANPFKLANTGTAFSLALVGNSSAAYADTPEDPNLYGIPTFAIPVDRINKWTIKDNSTWVQQHDPVGLKNKYGKCFDKETSKVIANKNGDYDVCNKPDNINSDEYQHYSQYVFDQYLAHRLVMLHNKQSSPSETSVGTGSSTTGSTVTGDAQQLAQQIKDLAAQGKVTYLTPDVGQDIDAAASGQPGTAGVMTSSAILKLILAVAQQHTVEVSAIQSNGRGHCNNTPKASCPNDPHYTGDGVDFAAVDGVALTGRDANSIMIINLAETVLPSGSGFGQFQCGTGVALQVGFHQVVDSCNHLHVEVPNGTP